MRTAVRWPSRWGSSCAALAGSWLCLRRDPRRWLGMAAAWGWGGPGFLFLANMPHNPHALAIVDPHYLLSELVLVFWAAEGVGRLSSPFGSGERLPSGDGGPMPAAVDLSHPELSFAEFREFSASALRALGANKLRSALSMLGILIGVAAVIAMLALGQGAQNSIEAQLASLGSNLLTTDDSFTLPYETDTFLLPFPCGSAFVIIAALCARKSFPIELLSAESSYLNSPTIRFSSSA